MKDSEDIKNELINQIVMNVWNELGEQNAKKLQGILFMHLTGYEVSKKSTEVALYEENETEKYITKFLITKKINGCTDRTLEFYASTDRKIFATIGKSPMQTETDDIRLYIARRQMQDKVSDVTVNNEIRALSSFFQWMQQEEIRLKNPMRKIAQIKVQKRKKEAFTDLEVEKMRSYLKTNRERALFELLLSTWCRATEISQILLSEIDGEKILVHGKGKKDRTVYINARAQVALQAYLAERKDNNPYLFPRRIPIASIEGKKEPKDICKEWYKNPKLVEAGGHTDVGSIENIIRQIGRKNGIIAHPHKFRRTGATFALRAGMPIEQVSKMLGHNSIATTQIYLDIREEDVRQAHERYVR